jgi:zinc protease
MVRFAWHSPIAYQDGDADMILLARVLGEDQSGRLYRRLVLDEGLASEVSVGQQSLIARSIFRVDVRALPGADLDRIEAIVHEEIDRVAADGVPDDELARARAGSCRRRRPGTQWANATRTAPSARRPCRAS